jgi:anti-anti-sigma regulatory factor
MWSSFDDMGQEMSPNGTRLEPEGEVTLAEASAWQARLVAALDARSPTVVDLSRVSRLDLAALQLIESAQASFRLAEVPLQVEDEGARVWMRAMAAAGFPPLGEKSK